MISEELSAMVKRDRRKWEYNGKIRERNRIVDIVKELKNQLVCYCDEVDRSMGKCNNCVKGYVLDDVLNSIKGGKT